MAGDWGMIERETLEKLDAQMADVVYGYYYWYPSIPSYWRELELKVQSMLDELFKAGKVQRMEAQCDRENNTDDVVSNNKIAVTIRDSAGIPILERFFGGVGYNKWAARKKLNEGEHLICDALDQHKVGRKLVVSFTVSNEGISVTEELVD